MKSLSYNDLNIIYEDNHIIVVNKPCGILIQGDNTGDKPLAETIKDYLVKKYKKPGKAYLGVVHRLDRPTSGAVIFAKTSKALSRLNEQFKEKITKKIYWAMVSPKPKNENEQLVHYLVRNPTKNKSFAHIKAVENSKQAILTYRLIKHFDHYSLIEIDIETGRHHQIRAQLAKINLYIKGDLKYGAKRSNPNGGIHLHARTLSVIHPTLKTEMTFIAPLPEDNLWQLTKNIL